jgi:site-specific DNA recombinase
MKLVGYARVSTVKQIEGTSLTTQKEAIESYCKLKGYEIVFLFVEEGKSGKKDSYRPQYDNLKKRVVVDPG